MGALTALALAQVSRRVNALKPFLEWSKVRPGWIRYMRQALGMTLADLGKEVGVSVSTIAQAERREPSGKITVETLKKIADGMNCELVYAFVPRVEIKKFLEQRARERARQILTEADKHMALEDQAVRADFDERVDRLAKKLLATGDIW
ncbi:MAG: transcriptional regulator [Bdellovibrionaceae bacterium]|nr:transcriptional regulator [Pseudobdellovibrionaceae bacterium]|tara:strand:- start:5352 stop:5798 length:447 start_codon:yes stop_codon:yes gene_type:complete